ncbi:tyrosine-type recombinase/integrase [Streptomyces sp. NPDC056194]|uniref:tyrosine-type recombinase/integrase n=1 Tax=unclassified Streptomyces TaxID=2593676 RepID=UPI0035DFBE2C
MQNRIADEHGRSTVKNGLAVLVRVMEQAVRDGIIKINAGPDPDARLFIGPRGGRISTAVLRDAIHWNGVVTELGYEQLRCHDLRHTGPTWFADAGVPVHVLRKIAGHGSLTTTQRYLRPDVRQITAAGAAPTAHLSVLRAPRSLPSPIVVAR